VANKIVHSYPSLKWVADYRDLWSQNHILAAKGIFRYVERNTEKRIIKRANHITTVSEPLAIELRTLTHNSVPVTVIYNGYEDGLLRKSSTPIEIKLPNQIRIVYTGTIYKGRRDPSPLLLSLVELEQEGKLKIGDVKVEFYGGANDNLSDIIHSCNAYNWVSVKGSVSYKESIRIQQTADFLLFLESNKKDAKGVLTGKLFEYIAANKPILGVGIDSSCVTGQLIEATKTGVVFGEDKEQIKKYLLSVRRNGIPLFFSPDWHAISQYSRDVQSRKMLAILVDEYNAR
jgi:hypothetical protein